jgi:predicted amidophosphoribosyltransferase
MVRGPAELADLVLPRRCVGCGRPAAGLCSACLGSAAPLHVVQHELAVFAGAAYSGAVRAALLRYKERGRRDLAAPLATLLARAVKACPAGRGVPSPVLVCVPSSRADAAARGGDHVRRLAYRASRRAGVPVAPNVLVLARRKGESAGLGVQARAANLAGAFAARDPCRSGSAAIVVDDIVTTGATLREACRALRAAGWPVAAAAVVAATPLRARRDNAAVADACIGSSWEAGLA